MDGSKILSPLLAILKSHKGKILLTATLKTVWLRSNNGNVFMAEVDSNGAKHSPAQLYICCVVGLL